MYAPRAFGAVEDHEGSAALAAATAASASASDPSDMTAHGASVEGSITCRVLSGNRFELEKLWTERLTWKSLAATGGIQRPLM